MTTANYFMNKALKLAKTALQGGEFPVGCVLVKDGEIVSDGSRENSNQLPNEIDHAEMIALRRLLANKPDIDMSQVSCYSTLEPCLMCYSTMLISGITTFVYGYEDAMGGGTALKLAQLTPLYQEMRPVITPHILRQESLQLFKQFFSNPVSNYLQNTYLASYTLEQ